jgi:hypothetical protein
MSKILKLLNKTEQEYEVMYFGAYWRWCESVTITSAQTQMVLANTAVNKYYNTEFAKCENEFLTLIKDYPNTQPAEALELYIKCTFSMFNKRSLILIKQAISNNLDYAN